MREIQTQSRQKLSKRRLNRTIIPRKLNPQRLRANPARLTSLRHVHMWALPLSYMDVGQRFRSQICMDDTHKQTRTYPLCMCIALPSFASSESLLLSWVRNRVALSSQLLTLGSFSSARLHAASKILFRSVSFLSLFFGLGSFSFARLHAASKILFCSVSFLSLFRIDNSKLFETGYLSQISYPSRPVSRPD